MNAFLRLHFPTLFGYFDATTTGFQDIPDESDSTGLKRLSYQLPYILLKKNRKNYSLVDDTHPTADSYVDSMSSGKAKGVGFKAKTLYLGKSFHTYTQLKGTNRPVKVTRRRIPQEVIDEWFSPSQAPLIPVDSLKRRRSSKHIVQPNQWQSHSTSQIQYPSPPTPQTAPKISPPLISMRTLRSTTSRSLNIPRSVPAISYVLHIHSG